MCYLDKVAILSLAVLIVLGLIVSLVLINTGGA